MYLTIRDTMQLFQNKSVHLAAGSKGVDHNVLSANIMDAPDILNWVKAGDLILTTAYIIKDNPDLQERIIRELAAAGAAGLGIKTKRFLPNIPDIILQTADELNFPVLDLPVDMSLTEIMNPIISSIADKQSYILNRTIEIQTTLNPVAIQDKGLSSIIHCLSDLTQSPAICYDINGNSLVQCLPAKFPGISAELLQELTHFMKKSVPHPGKLHKQLASTKTPDTEELDILDRHCYLTSFLVISNHETFGHIAILQFSNTFLEINCIAIQQTCIVAALDFAKQKAIAQAQRLQTHNILDCLLSDEPDKTNLNELLETSHIRNAHSFECWVVHMDTTDNADVHSMIPQIYRTAQQFLNTTHLLSIVSEHAGRVIVLTAGRTESPDEPHPATELWKRLKKVYKHLQIAIGVGTMVRQITHVRQSYQAALTCLRIGQLLKGIGQITFPYEIACYSMLENKTSANLLLQIFSPVIEKLEKENHTLVHTLSVYLEYEQRLLDTANALYIHRNTLTNRLEKISSLTELDFNNKEAMLGLRLALRLWQHDALPANKE